MPRRPPINPDGYYHVSSRGTYGVPIFRDDADRELFLRLYHRAATKYRWTTLTWALKSNHHHFAIKLTDGGLSEGMRELHSQYSRHIHAELGLTNTGHLVRHAFFAREATSNESVIDMCRYVDLNGYGGTRSPSTWTWCGYLATMGGEPPRPFHKPSALLELINPDPLVARRLYAEHVAKEIAERAERPPKAPRPTLLKSLVPSPNQG